MSLYGELLWKIVNKVFCQHNVLFLATFFFFGAVVLFFGRAARFLDVHPMRNGNSSCRSLITNVLGYQSQYWQAFPVRIRKNIFMENIFAAHSTRRDKCLLFGTQNIFDPPPRHDDSSLSPGLYQFRSVPIVRGTVTGIPMSLFL